MLVVLLLLVVLAVAELYVIVQVAGEIGALNTIGLLIITSVLGVWLVKRAGLSVLARVQGQAARGRVPTDELVDGALLLLAGVLVMIPGFITDVVGILLIIPPTRALLRKLFRGTVVGKVATRTTSWANARGWSTVVVDVDSREDFRRPNPPPPPQNRELDP